MEISRNRKSLYITISVEEGEQYRFGNMAFSGDLSCDDRDLLKQIESAIDDNATGLPLSRELTTIKCDVKLDVTPDSLHRQPPDEAGLRPLYQQLDFRRTQECDRLGITSSRGGASSGCVLW